MFNCCFCSAQIVGEKIRYINYLFAFRLHFLSLIKPILINTFVLFREWRLTTHFKTFRCAVSLFPSHRFNLLPGSGFSVESCASSSQFLRGSQSTCRPWRWPSSRWTGSSSSAIPIASECKRKRACSSSPSSTSWPSPSFCPTASTSSWSSDSTGKIGATKSGQECRERFTASSQFCHNSRFPLWQSSSVTRPSSSGWEDVRTSEKLSLFSLSKSRNSKSNEWSERIECWWAWFSSSAPRGFPWTWSTSWPTWTCSTCTASSTTTRPSRCVTWSRCRRPVSIPFSTEDSTTHFGKNFYSIFPSWSLFVETLNMMMIRTMESKWLHLTLAQTLLWKILRCNPKKMCLKTFRLMWNKLLSLN